ncbi:IclR family transcriptional regulator [Streptomyces sp. NPDC052052]|uniref:IclR family transcriptional regulator n=1 Tax=Streptomyces sp. NPDC052052 TaxID=3154756 RepID=UPI00341CA140
MEEQPSKATYINESLEAGLRLLRLFVTDQAMTVTDAAKALGVARSTAHRLVATLEAQGFLARNTAGRGYSTGPELARLGAPSGFDDATQQRVRPVLDDAWERTSETVQVVVLVGGRTVITGGRQSPREVCAVLEVGRSYPAHATAGGKLLLSQLTDEQVGMVYPDEELVALTPRTLTSRAALLDELAVTRERGYAVSCGESVEGMHAVGVPLGGPGWHDRFALMACAPADRGGDAALARWAEELQRSAALWAKRR